MSFVSQVVDPKQDRISRRQVDKFAERRAQLAASALLTLSELGYARTSLREIAQNSEFSHGVLHYYFRDKAECVTRYDQVVATSRTAEGLRERFGAAMAQTLREDGSMHRLWYDLRNQSLFEKSFQEDVTEIDRSLERMIWRIVTRYAELSGSTLTVTSRLAYALFDGVFQQALFWHLAGGDTTSAELREHVGQVLDRVTASV
ncbi:MAG: TetR family transcriptional regulator [Actinophytocola sp.]|uniref:TetR/AcrR family transcriptional regulator n=1 Tax=Actinophytocola sp. TaxID=1872138 RepID=UPI0013227131|nr:TetR/AcrR family transcriptional regulator [Actinophytocola sp.]MPZ83656.1 TetR family transcriptional regulator [Actinophytocola sp.]